MGRIVFVEQMVSHDGVDIGHDAHEHHDVAHAGNGTHQRRHDEPQVPDGRDQAHHAQQPGEAGDHRKLAGGRHQGKDDDQEVEYVPAVPEVTLRPGPQGQHLEGSLNDEHSQGDVVAQVQPVAVEPADGGRSLQPQDDPVDDDDADDEVFEPGVVHQTVGEVDESGHGFWRPFAGDAWNRIRGRIRCVAVNPC